MKEISYVDARILKDILESATNNGVRICTIPNDEYLEFGINWSAFGTQSVGKTLEFINDLQTATKIVKKINDLELRVVYEKTEAFNSEEDYLKRKAELEKAYIR